MSNDSLKTISCCDVRDEWAAILDGSAPVELSEHVTNCDDCRDVRHDLVQVAARVKEAGEGFQVPDYFVGRLLAAVDVHRTSASVPLAAAAVVPSALPAPRFASEIPRHAAHVVRWLKGRRYVVAGSIAAIAAASAGLWWRENGSLPGFPRQGAPWQGSVTTIVQAGKATAGAAEDEFVRCTAAGTECAAVTEGAALSAGSLLRTGSRTRAELRLNDGTTLTLDRDTELALSQDLSRSARLLRGSLVADIAHHEKDADAKMMLPGGVLTVRGTKFAVRAEPNRSRVEVVRGVVELQDERGRVEVVRAGEEGRLAPGQPVAVVPTAVAAEALAWTTTVTRDTDSAKDEEPVRGLGELRAKKPGAKDERDAVVRLVKHDVNVRIVDNVARTEIDETFQNDSPDELEGIFRFPLPPDGQIERLALEVNGKLEEGAFVERDKAAAIWRGVLQHATPHAPKPQEEIIWVPGPWRDPALLEWKRGGRFELRIFPIPARGSRRVVLAYTQLLPAVGGVRRYTYPLPYDPRGSTLIDQFHVRAQVLGHDRSVGLHAQGYVMTPVSGDRGDAQRLEMTQSRFLPAGDLTLEYALPNREAEASAWAYAPPLSSGRDSRPYALFALRPKLPRARSSDTRTPVIVVDASRSMVGERWTRATAVTAAIVREMDAHGPVHVLACDSTCRTIVDDLPPGSAAAAAVRQGLGVVTPDGAADLLAMVRGARAVAKGHDFHMIYVGDGGASAGPTKADHVTAEVERALGRSDLVTAVAVGADADTTTLAALARGGGGVVIPYVPGQRAMLVATAVATASSGSLLRAPLVTLPPGFDAVSPSALDTIRAGGETIVVARMSGTDLSGDVVLRGSVGGEPFEQRYPLHVVATTDAGNAFVPRVYAAERIADLERTGGAASRATIVELSQQFAVASRFTSLLVLESEAMLHAFGLHRASAATAWTGEVSAIESTADGTVAIDGEPADAMASEESKGADKKESVGSFSAPGLRGSNRGGGGLDNRAFPSGAAQPAKRSRAESQDREDSPAPPSAPAPSAAPKAASGPMTAPPAREEPWSSNRRMIPMRKVWDRKGTVTSDGTGAHASAAAKVAVAESVALSKPDSRAATRDLFALYAAQGLLDRASDVAERWAARDALDPSAIVARADVAARRGDRETALRILGGLADLRPDDTAAQTRLAQLFERAGDLPRGCAHRIALAEQRPGDAPVQGAAIQCARTTGSPQLAERLLADIAPEKRAAVDHTLTKASSFLPSGTLAGDVQIDATWDTDTDLDLALIDGNGLRLSWLGGGKAAVTARDVNGRRTESVAWSNLAAGTYVLELTSARAASSPTSISGSVTVRVVGETKRIPFVLTRDRTEIAQLRIFYTPRLVPLSGPPSGLRPMTLDLIK